MPSSFLALPPCSRLCRRPPLLATAPAPSGVASLPTLVMSLPLPGIGAPTEAHGFAFDVRFFLLPILQMGLVWPPSSPKPTVPTVVSVDNVKYNRGQKLCAQR